MSLDHSAATLLRWRFHGDGALLIRANRARDLGALANRLGMVAHELRGIDYAVPAAGVHRLHHGDAGVPTILTYDDRCNMGVGRKRQDAG